MTLTFALDLISITFQCYFQIDTHVNRTLKILCFVFLGTKMINTLGTGNCFVL